MGQWKFSAAVVTLDGVSSLLVALALCLACGRIDHSVITPSFLRLLSCLSSTSFVKYPGILVTFGTKNQ